MPAEVTVHILNWNCLKNGTNMALAPNNANELVLQHLNQENPSQQWTLVPNLAVGAVAGGYTLLNNERTNGQRLSAGQPHDGQQIRLNDDTSPFGSKSYCWTVWPAGHSKDGQYNL